MLGISSKLALKTAMKPTSLSISLVAPGSGEPAKAGARDTCRSISTLQISNML